MTEQPGTEQPGTEQPEAQHHRMTQERWQESTEWPMMVAALVFLGAYAWSVIGDLHGTANLIAQIVMWVVWAVFLVDYVVNLVLAPHRVRWFFVHFYEFLIVALPMLRPLRLLRLITLWTILQRAAGTALRGRVAIYVVGSSLLLVVIAALAILDAERHAPGATITTYTDALWWAFVTITTVGYGDYTPVTELGRLIAVGMMVAGIALLGTVTATLASWLVERVRGDDGEQEQKATQAQITELSAQIDALSKQLTATDRTRSS